MGERHTNVVAVQSPIVRPVAPPRSKRKRMLLLGIRRDRDDAVRAHLRTELQIPMSLIERDRDPLLHRRPIHSFAVARNIEGDSCLIAIELRLHDRRRLSDGNDFIDRQHDRICLRRRSAAHATGDRDRKPVLRSVRNGSGIRRKDDGTVLFVRDRSSVAVGRCRHVRIQTFDEFRIGDGYAVKRDLKAHTHSVTACNIVDMNALSAAPSHGRNGINGALFRNKTDGIPDGIKSRDRHRSDELRLHLMQFIFRKKHIGVCCLRCELPVLIKRDLEPCIGRQKRRIDAPIRPYFVNGA